MSASPRRRRPVAEPARASYHPQLTVWLLAWVAAMGALVLTLG